MGSGPKRNKRKHLRWLAILPLLPVIALAFSTVYQLMASSHDALVFPPPGELIDIGGVRLQLYCLGQANSGSSIVVFEGGLGASSITWTLVQRRLAVHMRVCSYDRAGYGWSDSSPQPRTANEIAIELHTLLRKANEAPPYLLVGHSFGGIIVRLFASLYASETSGLVLVDARQEDFFRRMPASFLAVDESNYRTAKMLEISTPLGLTRLAGTLGFLDSAERYLAPLPDKQLAAAKAIMIYNTHHWQTAVAERAVIDISFDQVRQVALPANLPLIVLSAANRVEAWQPPGGTIDQASRDLWMALQGELAKLTTRSTWIIVENSGHYIQLDRPDAVAAAIVKLNAVAAADLQFRINSRIRFTPTGKLVAG